MRTSVAAFYFLVGACLLLGYKELRYTAELLQSLDFFTAWKVVPNDFANVTQETTTQKSMNKSVSTIGIGPNNTKLVVALTTPKATKPTTKGKATPPPPVKPKNAPATSPTTSKPVINSTKPLPPLLNMTNFHWLKNNENLCFNNKSSSNGTLKTLLIMLVSARQYGTYRKAIRNTWGALREHDGWSIHVIFLLGINDPALNWTKEKVAKEDAALEEEYKQFGDIVIGSIVDSYRNLTYKHMMAYKWALEFCSNADFVLKIDDHMFVDIPRILKRRKDDLASKKPVPNLYCAFRMGVYPERKNGQKWKVSTEEYPNSTYPTFCTGSGFGITVDLISKLYHIHNKVKFLWLEDVWATGLLVQEAKRIYNDSNLVVKENLGVQLNPKVYMEYCKKQEWNGEMTFSEITGVNRDGDYEKNLKCLLNIVKLAEASPVKSLLTALSQIKDKIKEIKIQLK